MQRVNAACLMKTQAKCVEEYSEIVYIIMGMGGLAIDVYQ